MHISENKVLTNNCELKHRLKKLPQWFKHILLRLFRLVKGWITSSDKLESEFVTCQEFSLYLISTGSIRYLNMLDSKLVIPGAHSHAYLDS